MNKWNEVATMEKCQYVNDSTRAQILVGKFIKILKMDGDVDQFKKQMLLTLLISLY